MGFFMYRRPRSPVIVVSTLLGPQPRFGDKLLGIGVNCPHIWNCGAKRVKSSSAGPSNSARMRLKKQHYGDNPHYSGLGNTCIGFSLGMKNCCARRVLG